MNRFYVQLNDGSHMNVPADRMELKENFLYAWRGTELIALTCLKSKATSGRKLAEKPCTGGLLS